MSAVTITSILSITGLGVGAGKRAVITATLPTSYDTGGSTLDMSSGNATLTALTHGPDAVFAKVHGVQRIGVAAASGDRYPVSYVRGTNGDPATGKLKARDLNDDGNAEVTSTTNLSGTTIILEVIGQ